MGEIVLKAKMICKSYFSGEDKLKVLNNFSIDVKRKEIVTISGQSGSGKSTALNILGTLDKADSGKLEIMNQDIFKLAGEEISRMRNTDIGFMFQFHHLLPEFTALENVLIPSWINNNTSKTVYAKELFDFLGIYDKMNYLPSQLSGGERSRIALVRAIINRPNILFADEPTGNLDKKNAFKLIDLLCKINEEFSQTIILTTHNPDVALIGNQKYTLDNGCLIIKK
tara:strand:+ start:403 stop:1080 length:678 start_codon:yes stop_codon:yes gene_type:complete